MPAPRAGFVRVTISMPVELDDAIRRLRPDPRNPNRQAWGFRSELIQRLLVEHCRAQGIDPFPDLSQL